MKKYFILLILTALAVACSDNHPYREPSGPENNLPGGSTNDAADNDILADDTPRIQCGETVLRADSPGVLYIVDNDFTRASMRDLTTGNHAEFSIRERIIFYNDKAWAHDAELLKADEAKGIYWYKGLTDTAEPAYFVVCKLES